jgi:hypothetical protein
MRRRYPAAPKRPHAHNYYRCDNCAPVWNPLEPLYYQLCADCENEYWRDDQETADSELSSWDGPDCGQPDGEDNYVAIR